ncbi:methyltransferase family protein [Marinicella rhabdoformis]|uniref:methyltransferase family protein n=1 Tax=Marinicella rhabdoformis TaxID=2580566 RepID=UPI0012AEB8A9|nr:NnrU family protein [Marinicella rhabdoformis]
MFYLLFGSISYLAFFFAFIYFIAFVAEQYVQNHLSLTSKDFDIEALLINVFLIIFWGVQHSVMARQKFKDKIAKIIPPTIERSVYVLVTAVVLGVVMWFWQPMPGVLWHFDGQGMVWLMWSIFFLGWGLVLLSTFLTDHFDLFGLRQVWLAFLKRTYVPIPFSERWLYQAIRHPMMLGLLMSLWAIPVMTVTHLVFAVGMSIYIFIGIYFEEKSLQHDLGEDYQQYKKRTKKIFPYFY